MTTNFGRDVSCTDSMRSGRYATGVRLVAEACYRRLTTPRGMLYGGEEEQNYGLDITSLVGTSSAKADAASLPGRIEAELRKDERIDTVKVTIDEIATAGEISWVVTIDVVTAEGPFALQIGVSEVTAQLLGIT